jgi:hypothetical protein
MRSSIFSHGVKILPGTSFARYVLKYSISVKQRNPVLLARGSVCFVEQHSRWLAEILQHTIRLEEVEHRALLSRTVLHGYA